MRAGPNPSSPRQRENTYDGRGGGPLFDMLQRVEGGAGGFRRNSGDASFSHNRRGSNASGTFVCFWESVGWRGSTISTNKNCAFSHCSFCSFLRAFVLHTLCICNKSQILYWALRPLPAVP